jgi:hypothetical protein
MRVGNSREMVSPDLAFVGQSTRTGGSGIVTSGMTFDTWQLFFLVKTRLKSETVFSVVRLGLRCKQLRASSAYSTQYRFHGRGFHGNEFHGRGIHGNEFHGRGIHGNEFHDNSTPPRFF